ncbi:hypothetical protein D9619_008378 [Psilocybe cf. subviscida]|uniref:Anaphase-promoting complex subunit 5 domain-containing protein n=1 Tax=Psilocybe cf. subviscida TaxID=2480587 RepID=A0A8H5BB34_9AGAR|nr:hypothetical protein D9619_008378 [Psilocybe cf. subviscida]
MKDFCVALLGLLDKFRSFEASILPLLPKTGRSKLGLFIRGWLNNNIIQENISDLESDIVRVIRKYMVKSAMRVEVMQRMNHQETIRGLTNVHDDVTQGLHALAVVERNVSAIAATTTPHRSYESSGTTSDEFNRSIIMFAQSTPSTSTPMLRRPEVITEELMTAAYIKLQIDSIAMIVENISTIPAPGAQHSVNRLSWNPIVESSSMSIIHLRHHVVREVTIIRDLLESEGLVQTVSIDAARTPLNNLSVALGMLGMLRESILVGNWTITLARTLVNAFSDGNPDCGATLVFYLFNQSIRYWDSGDKAQSLQTVKEAHTITQNLRNQYGGENRFQVLHSQILLHYATLVDNQQSMKMCIEAIHILEGILDVQAVTQTKSRQEILSLTVGQSHSSFLEHLFSSASESSITTIVVYALALEGLADCLLIDDHPDSALYLRLLALAVHRKLVSFYGHEYKTQLAEALLSLVQDGTASHMPAEQLLNIADDGAEAFIVNSGPPYRTEPYYGRTVVRTVPSDTKIQLRRYGYGQTLADNNPPYYARMLVNALRVKATTLQNLGQDAEAIAIWEEIASLARQIIQDSELCATALNTLAIQFRRLKRHDDAVRTGTLAITTYREGLDTQALGYFHLSRDLQKLRRYKEAAEAARTSVTLYRRLAIRDPETWMSDLTEGLSDLARCLAALGDYAEASIALAESVGILDNFLGAHMGASSDVIDRYCAALDIHHKISIILKDKEESLKVSSTAVQYFRRLSDSYPQNENIVDWLSWSEFRNAYNMLRVGCLQDALHHLEHWFDAWHTKNEAISESSIASWHAAMMNLKAHVLDAQGCTEQALSATLKVHGIVSLFFSTDRSCFLEMIESMHHEARLRWSLGDNGEALQVAEEALRLARANKLESAVGGLLWSLHAVAITASSYLDYNRAAEAAREGCNISAGQNWRSIECEYNIFLRPSLFALLSSAEANVGMYDTALEYAHCAVDASLEIADIKLYISATIAKQSYMETRGNLAEILLATGDLAQARQICEERSAYFSDRVENRMGEYRDLAPILRMLGVLCCSDGRHEEGDAAAKELSRIMRTLGSAFPSLQEQVKIRLRHQANVPILKVLDDMCHKLNCKHQAGIISLFAI